MHIIQQIEGTHVQNNKSCKKLDCGFVATSRWQLFNYLDLRCHESSQVFVVLIIYSKLIVSTTMFKINIESDSLFCFDNNVQDTHRIRFFILFTKSILHNE